MDAFIIFYFFEKSFLLFPLSLPRATGDIHEITHDVSLLEVIIEVFHALYI